MRTFKYDARGEKNKKEKEKTLKKLYNYDNHDGDCKILGKSIKKLIKIQD